MTDVIIAGIGQTPVGEFWDESLRIMATRAVLAALEDAGGLRPQAMYIGNFLGSVVSHQANLGSLLTDQTGLSGIEGITIEAAGASGGAALRQGYLAVASGFVDTAIVVGVEKYTDEVGPELETAIAMGMDYDFESVPGLSATSQAALLARRYIDLYHVPAGGLGGFPLVSHANGAANPNAMYRKAISREAYEKAEMVSDPLNLFDVAPYADGAAAVILTRPELAPDTITHPLVRVSGSGLAVDRLAVHDRTDPLAFDAVRLSVERACRQAGILPTDVDLVELSDSFSIYAALSLESSGFARCGEAWRMAQEGYFDRGGKLPVNTMGGLKARGNPLAATGVYQAVEATLQLRGQAGPAQVPGAKRAMIQSLGGPAATAVTHVLERVESHP